ncbi:SusD/RagB family nutrient-binding outer membrane lipoprotein [Mucilaginibacter polytrichastri]|nr:SusD/RagB family nutrient-binding outer membrane lipoprotein [Mucilaginibacter polytrichastri]SFS91414.1 Starch-binding associating with outer membrane [Mucilaginibacter polytrichastri]
MKKIFKNYMPLLALLLLVSSCKKSFEELTQNNNKPNNVPASLLFNGVANSLANLQGNSDLPENSSEIYDQYYLYNYDYYGNNRYDFGGGPDYYTTLKNVVSMEQQAAKAGLPALNPYTALGKFFRAYFFSKMSLEMGDIPMTQALQGLDGLESAYDKQKAVMQQSLAWLESANTDLTSLIAAGDNNLTNDIYFSNNLVKWQQVVNTFKLRLLIQLSKKATTDPDMNIPAQFAAIVNDSKKYPIMTSSSDNMQYVFVSPNNYYPSNPQNFGQSGSRKNTSSTYISLLTTLKDPRVFVTAEPARYSVDTLKKSPTDFASFIGADPGLDLGIMYNNAGLQRYSFINRKHFYSTFTGEPSIQIGYPELMFNIAEGINRGWVTGGDAEAYYQAGIKASMASYSIPDNGTFTAYFYRPGSTDVTAASNYDTYLIPTNFATYYNQTGVKYSAGNDGLTKILQQKYIALFRHSGLESYFTYRRTGIPVFTTGPGTGNGSRIASRFKYPSAEQTANAANYNKALQSQYAGNDDINGIMWVLK